MKRDKNEEAVCARISEICMCKTCSENQAFVKSGECTGCNECGKSVVCLMTGEKLIGPVITN